MTTAPAAALGCIVGSFRERERERDNKNCVCTYSGTVAYWLKTLSRTSPIASGDSVSMVGISSVSGSPVEITRTRGDKLGSPRISKLSGSIDLRERGRERERERS